MATQEIMVDNQPIEKEIEPVKKDSQQIKNEKISLEIREYIRRGVSKHLNGLITKYDVTSYTNSKEAKTDEKHRCGEMKLMPNELQVHPQNFPEAKNMNLAYKEESKFIYTLYLCEQEGSTITKFLYSWEDGKEIYVAAPYYVETGKEESVIMCSDRLDITKAVHSKKPIKAISKRLKKLKNSSNSKKGFDKDMYKWRKHEHHHDDDNDNNFTVSNEKKVWYWKKGEQENKGKIVQIQNKSGRARLIFDKF